MRRNIAVCWVLYDAHNDAIAGYYTLSTGSVDPIDLPADVVRKLPRYPAIPVMLVGRLALSADKEYRGHGLGGALLVDALRRALKLSESIGAVGVIVDAKDESARLFYERYGFQGFTDNALRLFIPMTTVERLASST